jgi:hypothetical protein
MFSAFFNVNWPNWLKKLHFRSKNETQIFSIFFTHPDMAHATEILELYRLEKNKISFNYLQIICFWKVKLNIYPTVPKSAHNHEI